MTKQRNKIVELLHTDVATAFAKESQLLKEVQKGQLSQALLLWRTCSDTLVLPGSNKWQESPELNAELAAMGWDILSRRTGGAPVPQTAGVINVSHIYLWQEDKPYSIPLAYQRFCQALTRFFEGMQLKTEIHGTPGSYCDGDYNLNIGGQKIVGTAQRVVLKHGGGSIVLAQACILIDADMEQLIEPVNLCYQHNNNPETIVAQVHTCLREHLTKPPQIEQLLQALRLSFTAD